MCGPNETLRRASCFVRGCLTVELGPCCSSHNGIRILAEVIHEYFESILGSGDNGEVGGGLWATPRTGRGRPLVASWRYCSHIALFGDAIAISSLRFITLLGCAIVAHSLTNAVEPSRTSLFIVALKIANFVVKYSTAPRSSLSVAKGCCCSGRTINILS